MDFDAKIERDNRGEVRVILTALFGMALLVVASVGIAVKDVNANNGQDSAAATLAPAQEYRAAPSAFD